MQSRIDATMKTSIGARASRPGRVGTRARPLLAAALAAGLAGCGDSSSEPPATDDPSPAPVAAPPDGPTPPGPVATTPAFAGSDVTVERFGTRTARDADPDADEATLAATVAAINDFSFDLHRAAVAAGAGGVESGYGALVALSLALAGTEGDTRAALAALLGLDAIEEDGVHRALNAIALALESRANEDLVLRVADRAFVAPDLPLTDAFLDVATGQYGAPVVAADFRNAAPEVVERINAWVSDATDGLIPTLLAELDPATRFVLLNAIFLDAAWRDPYFPVEAFDFTGDGGTTVPVAGFAGESFLPFGRTDGLTALEIPYGGDEIAMLVMMPPTGGLEALEASLDAAALDAIVGTLAPGEVAFTMPVWEDDASVDLVAALAPSGFPPNPWDFGRMIGPGEDPSLAVAALQKARIEVDENGTRAAAATAVVATTDSEPAEPERIVVDRPFVYALRDRTTGTVLFTGRVTSPGTDG